MSYPAGWRASVDTRPWTSTPGTYREPTGDLLFDPARADLSLKVASQSLGGTTFDQWSATVLEGRGCSGSNVPVVVDGEPGVLDSSCLTAAVSGGGRGYLIAATWSYDVAELRTVNWSAWFREVLATIQLRPEDAVDGPNPTLVPGATLGPTVTLDLTARDIAFTATTLDAPANAPIVIHFTNADDPTIVHVVDLRRSNGTTVIKEQEPIQGGTATDFTFDALPPGTYVLICRVHPIPSMVATLTVR
jgi:plastocyanin